MSNGCTNQSGKPYPLGASWDGEGVSFALFSEYAERVELGLFDPECRRETARFALPDLDARGRPLYDQIFLLLLNAHHDAVPFMLPKIDHGQLWRRLFDTIETVRDQRAGLSPDLPYPLQTRSLALFVQDANTSV